MYSKLVTFHGFLLHQLQYLIHIVNIVLIYQNRESIQQPFTTISLVQSRSHHAP